MNDSFHSVTLDRDKCKGCINCIKRCPTQAIRVREGKAHIITDLCIDCGECIRICPHHAKKAITDPLSVKNGYAYPIALVPPSFYAQFNNLTSPGIVHQALKKIGFAAVFDVGRAAELITDATRQLLDEGELKKPVISTACPAVVRLIRVRFPNLLDHMLPLIAPVELAARMARKEAEDAGQDPDEISCIFLTPCPAKVTAIRMPIGTKGSEIDAAVSVQDVYTAILPVMSRDGASLPAQTGQVGLGWSTSGGESSGLHDSDAYLAADGIENVLRVLEDIEDERYPKIDFVELNACPGGCVGGVLQVENPYISKTKIYKLSQTLPKNLNQLDFSQVPKLKWEKELTYSPALELGASTTENFARYEKLEEILEKLPGLDCGSCGAPTCKTFAEDVVRGDAILDDCVVLMRRRMEAILQAIGLQ